MQNIKNLLTSFIAQTLVVDEKLINLEHTDRAEFGDYATTIALKNFSNLEKSFRKKHQINNIIDYAKYLSQQLQSALKQNSQLNELVDSVQFIKPGFINFYLSDAFLTSQLHLAINKPLYGFIQEGKDLIWEIEHTSPNPNKAMHLGHLRNNITGMAIARLWESIGIKVICDAVNNDRGIAIAKLMWGYLKFAHKSNTDKLSLKYWHQHQDEWLTPEEADLAPDKFVDQLYTQASQDFSANKEVEQKVRQMVVDWENKDELTWMLWKKVLDYSLEGQQKTLQRLGNRWDKIWHEHEHYQLGKDLVVSGLKKGIFKKLPDGAVLTNLSDYNLPDTILIKADGTSLYITQDIALTKLKIDSFKAHKLHWVVGPEQSLALKQLFAVCEQLEIAQADELTHLSFGYMSIKNQGKMSSRIGNVIYIDDFIDEVKSRVKLILKQQAFTSSEINSLSESIAVGAVKYSILKIGRTTDIAFDFESALQIDGNSGPYLQYTFARAQSVIRKAGISQKKLSIDLNKQSTNSTSQYTELEKNILKLVYQFPEVINTAAHLSEPSQLCTYLYELAQSYNSFYNQLPIINSVYQVKLTRLGLTFATASILKKGLSILGIDTIDKM